MEPRREQKFLPKRKGLIRNRSTTKHMEIMMQNYTNARDGTKLGRPNELFKFKPQSNDLSKQCLAYVMGIEEGLVNQSTYSKPIVPFNNIATGYGVRGADMHRATNKSDSSDSILGCYVVTCYYWGVMIKFIKTIQTPLTYDRWF